MSASPNIPSLHPPPRLDELLEDLDERILSRLDRIIELLEVQVGALINAQEEADQPEEVDRGYLDG